ncbi:DUF4190 domain-containing protein [Microbacterium ureisolvens]|uniref:DUF4190 domain-containing protein n=1 Tax=Microbacterium ureisolvens TaxID=2781186 RepID=A0ABS7HUQ4_9MICO|nr:DUF4190 domain-containing protein [Microbacterium ureisolvens]MBW9109087.1 DUF4190 domain-containing protein [Microbacterium ureisolvens]
MATPPESAGDGTLPAADASVAPPTSFPPSAAVLTEEAPELPVAPPAPTPAAGAAKPPRNVALVALILGIVAFMLGWLPVVGLVLGALAVGFGITALRRRQSKGLAIPGIVMGGWGLLTSVIAILVLVVIAVQPQEFRDAVWSGYAQVLAGEAPTAAAEEDPVVAEEGGTPADPEDDTAVAAQEAPAPDFAALDDAGLAAIVADPAAARGQTYVVYGEVQQFDENTGPCSALILVDDAQQQTWEGYATTAWIAAESGEAVCPEFTGLGALSHIKAWVTVLGTTSTEWEDGTVEEVLTLMVRQYEALPALP